LLRARNKAEFISLFDVVLTVNQVHMPIEPCEEIRGDDKITLLREQIAQVDLVVDTESPLQQDNAGSGFALGISEAI